MKNPNYLLFALVFFIVGINYSFLDSLLVSAFQEEFESGIVDRIVDGDTIVVNGSKIRMLGINSPESGEVGYDNAKQFLIREIEGREVVLKFGKEKLDRYQRKLAYVFLDGVNVNLESVYKGYSSFYFPSGKDKYYSLFFDAWNYCLISETEICEKSLEACIVLKNWDYENEIVVLKNICAYEINLDNWSVKDEGRKKFILDSTLGAYQEIVLNREHWDEDYVWTKSGDSIFIRDRDNGLVHWETY